MEMCIFSLYLLGGLFIMRISGYGKGYPIHGTYQIFFYVYAYILSSSLLVLRTTLNYMTWSIRLLFPAVRPQHSVLDLVGGQAYVGVLAGNELALEKKVPEMTSHIAGPYL